MSTMERKRRAAQRLASLAKLAKAREERVPQHDKILRPKDMERISGLSRWTLYRAAKRGEFEIIQITDHAVGARASVFWAWLTRKATKTA